jgi:hypothetical protein
MLFLLFQQALIIERIEIGLLMPKAIQIINKRQIVNSPNISQIFPFIFLPKTNLIKDSSLKSS